MVHVEFLGPPGAGKTSVYSALAGEDRWYQLDVNEQLDANEVCRRTFLGRESLGRRLCYRTMPAPVRSLLNRKLLAYRYRDRARETFGEQHPEVIQQLFGAVGAVEHQPDKLARLIEDLVERYQLGVETARGREVLFLDEGFGMMAVSILWRKPSARFALERYLDRVPTPEVLVHVRAPPEVCLNRQEGRGRMGIWEPWVGEDTHAEQVRFSELCTRVADAQRANTTVVTVDSTGTVEDAVDRIRPSLVEALGTGDLGAEPRTAPPVHSPETRSDSERPSP